jgi:hypothetical protein
MTMRSGRTRYLWRVVAGAAMVALAAGCAQGSGAGAGGQAGGPAAASTTGPAAPPATTSPPTSTAPKGTPPATTSAGGSNVIVRGTVRQGVEPGCLLLDAQDKRAYLLMDADPSTVRPGATVEIVGQKVDQIVSYCGEGVVLSVVSSRPLR